MSSREFSSTGRSLSSSRCEQRTPLRSVENEMLRLSTPSLRLKSNSLLNTDIVKDAIPFCDSELHSQSTKVIQTNDSSTDTTNDETVCGIGNVTFKSFICTGGEVEIIDSFLCEQESIILPKDQAMKTTTEDTAVFDSLIVESCSDHIEHPYQKPEVNDPSLDVNTARLCDTPNITPHSVDLNDEKTMQDFTASKHDLNDLTWKSLVCDGGEVEVSDVSRLQDETIPLPKTPLGLPLQDNSVNSTHHSCCGQLSQEDHSDHPYCISENGVFVNTTISEITNEELSYGLSDRILKSFNCNGDKIQISDGSTLPDGTLPLSAIHTEASTELDIHPFCLVERPSVPNANLAITPGPLPFSLETVDDVKQKDFGESDGPTDRQEGICLRSLICARDEDEDSDVTRLSQKMSFLPDDQPVICHPLDDDSAPTFIPQDHIQDGYKQTTSHVENDEVVDADPPTNVTPSQTNKSLNTLYNEFVNSQVQETPKEDSIHPMDSVLSSVPHRINSDSIHLASSAETPAAIEVNLEHVSQADLSIESHTSSESKDSGVSSSKNGLVFDSAEKPHPEHLSNVLKVLSRCPSVASALQSGLLSPVVRRASQLVLEAIKDSDADQSLADDSVFECEKSLLAPVQLSPIGICVEHLESPMPRPLMNSTALGCKAQPGPVTEPVEDVGVKPCAVPRLDEEKPVLDIPLNPDGPLQQQLRQMAEFLFLASGKMVPSAVSATAPCPTVALAPSTRASPAESHSVCVGTTPTKWIDHGINTSGEFERKRDFSVLDSCTLTDPLLWNVPPGSLECLPRQELEQRLMSSMIMVEVLVQQLSASRTQGNPAGPAPSDLREKLVQTDHTELSQTTIHRDLYLEALSRISELELDQSSLQDLFHCMQNIRVDLTSLSCNTDAALSSMTQIGDVVREDHQSLVAHYGQMKSLLAKTKETKEVMMQKVKDALHQRDDIRIQMEEAFTAKEAAFSVVEQLRTHSATEISALERIVGSQQELSAALHQTNPEMVALNQASTEMLNSASAMLSTSTEEHSSLMEELCTVRGLLQKASPMLLRLNEKAAAAVRERDEYISARDQAVDEREQLEQELHHTNLNLQAAGEQIGDLNIKVTILTSEMGVLRQKLTERDEEKGQLERKVTELSATTSSTLASYAFLEQALAAESNKLQESWKDILLAKDRAKKLETSLSESEQRENELSLALAQREEEVSQLQALSKSQNEQIQQLQDVCTQLSGVQEMNEFLQMENQLAREQMTESESMLRANLQGLRERNMQCEDLKGEHYQLQLENRTLQEELDVIKSRASATQLELGEKLAQTATEITLLHHTLRGLTNELHAALNDQRPDPLKDNESQVVHNVERRHPSSSFVDSVMVALTAEVEEDATKQTSPGPADKFDSKCETLFSERSAFTRIVAVTPKKNLNTEFVAEEDDQTSVPELFADLDRTVTELISNLKLLRQSKDAQLEEQRNIICGLQVEQQAANNRHQKDVAELQLQLSHLNSLAERGSQALQQKAQDEKTLTNLMSDLKDAQEILNKHKTESNELRKEVVELRRSQQQSKVESQFLRGELRKAGGQSAPPAHFMEEKIQLLKEVERLKSSLQEAEQARVKLLERAKRHQIIHQTNQQKSENELQLLNHMINKVRKTLLSLPNLKDSEELQQLVEYIG